jgi:nucleotide-binding universal stress UspA family protein
MMNNGKTKKILIALDDNETAGKMAEIGYKLAKSMNARTVLLHVISDTTYYSSLNYSPIVGFGYASDAVQTDTVEVVRALAKNYLDQFREKLGDDKIETVVETGDFAEMILQTAKRRNVDIIVMGAHGRHGLQKILLESAAEKVLNDSLIPLFIIPTKALNGVK